MLKRVSEVFRESLRSFDLLARYGGEEFCVLLSNSEAATAQSIAQRLSYLTADLRAGPQRDHPVTISIGATALEDNDRNVDDLMKRADHALYQAKCSGRNCIIGFANALDAP